MTDARPWHAWRFRVCDGTWCDNPRVATDRFEVTVDEDGTLLVTVDDEPEPNA